MHTIGELAQVLEEIAPSYLAENWDNVGLLIGSRRAPVSKVLCTLDLTQEVLEEAIAMGANCIVTHHPFLFSPLKRLDLDSPKGAMIAKVIKHDIAVYSMHTNLDTITGGINDVLCEGLGVREVHTLHVTYREPLSKLCIYVPQTHSEVVREALIAHNQYCIGNYTGCTFTGVGEGTFIPLEGANPFIGEQQVLEKVPEVKIETIVRGRELANVLNAVQKVHPYEEIAYDVFELQNMMHSEGLGRYGKIQAQRVEELAQTIKSLFSVPAVRIVGDLAKEVEKVAICSGSGSSFLGDAARVAEVYITGDMKFHEAQEALDLGLCVIDMGHYASENVIVPILAERIKNKLPTVTVVASCINAEVFKTI